jgi:hypothetical protein
MIVPLLIPFAVRHGVTPVLSGIVEDGDPA